MYLRAIMTMIRLHAYYMTPEAIDAMDAIGEGFKIDWVEDTYARIKYIQFKDIISITQSDTEGRSLVQTIYEEFQAHGEPDTIYKQIEKANVFSYLQ